MVICHTFKTLFQILTFFDCPTSDSYPTFFNLGLAGPTLLSRSTSFVIIKLFFKQSEKYDKNIAKYSIDDKINYKHCQKRTPPIRSQITHAQLS